MPKFWTEKSFVLWLARTEKGRKIKKAEIYWPILGCFGQAIQFGIMPLAKAHKLDKRYISMQFTVVLELSTFVDLAFSCEEQITYPGISFYAPATLGRIMKVCNSLQENTGYLFFLPNRGNFTRGYGHGLYRILMGVWKKALWTVATIF